MELWIRSQDKSKIVKVNELYSSLQEDFGTGKFGIYSSNTNYYQKERPLLLGNYKTKERALEVLDEIQRIIHPTVFMSSEINTDDNSWVENGIIYQKYKDNFDIQELSTYVYEMPKE